MHFIIFTLVQLSICNAHYQSNRLHTTVIGSPHFNYRLHRPFSPHTLVERRFGSPTAISKTAIQPRIQHVIPTKSSQGYPKFHPSELSLEDRVIRKLLGTHAAVLHQEEQLWPHGVFIPPADPKRMGYGPNDIASDDYGWREYDPFLLTGYEAFAAVQRLTAKGELFFEDIPHDRQLRWLNFIRKCNRLAGHIRASERPGFPYYRI